MFFKKQGIPERGELVICTVKRILPHAAFVKLDEYDNLEAMLHVSEVSSRWVRNIKEFVTEGKKIVCKVLDLHEEKGHIDVSLKRVTNSEKNKKLNDEKTEIRIEKLIEVIAKKMKEDPKKALQDVGCRLIDYFGSLSDFYEYMKKEGVQEISDVDIPDKWKSELTSQIQEQLDSARVKVSKPFELRTFQPNGILEINNFFSKLAQFAKSNEIELKTSYISAPQYSFDIIAKNYKEAEAKTKKIIGEMKQIAKQSKIEFTCPEED